MLQRVKGWGLGDADGGVICLSSQFAELPLAKKKETRGSPEAEHLGSKAEAPTWRLWSRGLLPRGPRQQRGH